MPDLVISIVSHPSGEVEEHARLLDQCVASLHATIRRCNYRIVLTNNLAPVDVFGRMRCLRGDEELLVNETSLGFAANHNRVAMAAPEPFVFILNDDTVVCEGAVDGLVDALKEDPRAAVAGPRVYTDLSRREVQPTAGTRVMTPERAILWRLMRETPLIGMRRLRPLYSELTTPPAAAEVLHLQGAALMVRTVAYREAGGMDEGYGMYREETDFCLELRRRGWKILYHPETAIVHFGGASTRDGVYRDQYQESLDRFLIRHYGRRASFVLRVIQPPLLGAVRALRGARRQVRRGADGAPARVRQGEHRR